MKKLSILLAVFVLAGTLSSCDKLLEGLKNQKVTLEDPIELNFNQAIVGGSAGKMVRTKAESVPMAMFEKSFPISLSQIQGLADDNFEMISKVLIGNAKVTITATLSASNSTPIDAGIVENFEISYSTTKKYVHATYNIGTPITSNATLNAFAAQMYTDLATNGSLTVTVKGSTDLPAGSAISVNVLCENVVLTVNLFKAMKAME